MRMIDIFLVNQIIINSPSHGQLGGHYFRTWCPSVRHKNKNALTRLVIHGTDIFLKAFKYNSDIDLHQG